MDTNEINQMVKEAFAKLPAVVQSAITSAEIQKRLRGLSQKHQLHLDQWEQLENEVLMIVMGIQPTELLEENIVKEVGVDAAVAKVLAADISDAIFDPIRRQLEQVVSEAEVLPITDAQNPQTLSNEVDLSATARFVVSTEKAPSPLTSLEKSLPHLQNETSIDDTSLNTEKVSTVETPKANRGSLVPPTSSTTVANPLKKENDPYREPFA